MSEEPPREATIAGAPERYLHTRRPAPDYPRYRVRPGEPARLADRDPAETEGYQCKEEAGAPLAAQRERIADLQARLYAERRCGVLIVFQAMDAGGRTARSTASFAASTLTVASCGRSRRQAPRSRRTTSSGDTTAGPPPGAPSRSSTARTTRTCWCRA